MKTQDYLLNFLIHFGRELIANGESVENAKTVIENICKRYNLRQVSVFILSNNISIGINNTEGRCMVRQLNIYNNVINLKKVHSLNELANTICMIKPEPEKLQDMLYSALIVEYCSSIKYCMGYILAMCSLCCIFGGHLNDIFVIAITTCMLIKLNEYCAREKLNRIVINAVIMFVTSLIAFCLSYINFTTNVSSIIITNAFFLIPGIPMTNAARSILSENVMNGILELIKVILEVMAIVVGAYVAYLFSGENIQLFGG